MPHCVCHSWRWRKTGHAVTSNSSIVVKLKGKSYTGTTCEITFKISQRIFDGFTVGLKARFCRSPSALSPESSADSTPWAPTHRRISIRISCHKPPSVTYQWSYLRKTKFERNKKQLIPRESPAGDTSGVSSHLHTNHAFALWMRQIFIVIEARMCLEAPLRQLSLDGLKSWEIFLIRVKSSYHSGSIALDWTRHRRHICRYSQV